MTMLVEEEIWALEEAGARHIRDGDLAKSLSYYHEKFLGWPEVASPLVDEQGIREIIENDIAVSGSYTFEIERMGIRIFENTATTHLMFHCQGKASDGVEFEESYRWTHTWVREGSEWTLLAGMSYEIAKP